MLCPHCPHYRLSSLCSAIVRFLLWYCTLLYNIAAVMQLWDCILFLFIAYGYSTCRLLCYPDATCQRAVCPAWPLLQHSWSSTQRLKHCKAVGLYTCTQTPQPSVQPQKLQIAAPKLGTHRMPNPAHSAAAAATLLLLSPLP